MGSIGVGSRRAGCLSGVLASSHVVPAPRADHGGSRAQGAGMAVTLVRFVRVVPNGRDYVFVMTPFVPRTSSYPWRSQRCSRPSLERVLRASSVCLLSVFPLGSLVARSTGPVESTARFPEGGDPSSTSWMSPSVPAFLLSRSSRDRRNALHTGSRLAAATPGAVHRYAYLARRTLISRYTR